MNEIRFSPLPRDNKADSSDGENRKEHSIPKNQNISTGVVIKTISTIVGILVILTLFYFGKDTLMRTFGFDGFDKKLNDAYSAVFLTNGQVYFGKIAEKDKSEILLKEVYYLQVNDNANQALEAVSQARFNLVKLGSELHGPTDELYINRDQVIFYEYLRNDSQVLELIKNYKQ